MKSIYGFVLVVLLLNVRPGYSQCDTLVAQFTFVHSWDTAYFTQYSLGNIKTFWWSFSDSSIDSSQNPIKLAPCDAGDFVCLTVVDTCLDSNTFCSDYSPRCGGISDLKNLFIFNLFPNPALDLIYFDTPVEFQKFEVNIYSSLGTLISQLQCQDSKCSSNISNLPNGVYYVSIAAEYVVETKKLIIRH